MFAVWESHGSSTDFSLFTVGGEVGEQGGGSYKCLYHLPLLQGVANFTHIYFKVQLVGNLLLLGFILEYNFYFLLNKHGIIKKKGGLEKTPGNDLPHLSAPKQNQQYINHSWQYLSHLLLKTMQWQKNHYIPRQSIAVLHYLTIAKFS